MQKKQAVEQRIRELVPDIDEPRGATITDAGVGTMYIKMSIQLHHVLQALGTVRATKENSDIDVLDRLALLPWEEWNLAEPLSGQDSELIDFLHDLLIENV